MSVIEELQEFKKFKENYQFSQKIIEGKEYCEGYSLTNDEGKMIGECDEWINVGYNHEGSYAKVLSNLFPYDIVKNMKI